MFDLLQPKYNVFAHKNFISNSEHTQEVPHEISDQTDN